MIKNMKIGKILMLAFLMVALISSIAGVVGLLVMMNISANYNAALTNYGFAQGDVGRLSAEFNNSRAIIRDIIIYTDEDSIKKTAEKLDTSLANVDKDLASVQKTIQNGTEKGYYDTITENMTAYKALKDRVVTLAKENKNADAQTLLISEGSSVLEKISSSIDALLNAKTTAGNEISANLSRQKSFAMFAMIAVIAIAFLISLLIAIKISRDISKPVKEMSEAAKRMAEGDLNVEIDFHSKNEIGELGEAFSKSTASIRAYIADITKNLGEVEHGNLNVTTELDYIGDYVDLKNSFFGILAFLNDTMTQINQAAEQVATGSTQVSDGAQSLAQGATEQASSIEELSASITEISAQVKDNASNAVNASKNVLLVSSEIDTSNRHMEEMLSAMTQINDSSSQIGKIIKTIEDIAFQTNILALNAAVEAARAGTAGKGFAVVADEVRNLASKSAEAAKNTTSLIENSMKQVESGAKIADETAKSLLRVVESANVVTENVEHISKASAAQSDAIEQVTLGVDQISSVIQTNSATAEESAAASEELSGQAQTMKALVAKFRLKEQGYQSQADLPAFMEEKQPELYSAGGKY
ncbi:methyl-accepting chemotaxis protein [Caproiciproducens sp.]|uniref:methyl-accepting chemotaxis protein n=1 Tax=Caproiciproducens sp. TaxID=1954376 RepID=UPI00289A84EC|nr:methyl-accepting chemotaxis protein [Caproiciproducens sp.]